MKQLLKQIISDFHTTPLPPFKRRELDVPLRLNKIVTITGPRRAGKTYYLYQLITDLEEEGIDRRQILYINFEDERLDLEGNYDLIFDAYRELHPDQQLTEVYLFFDEIQELSNWEKFVRRVDDTLSRHIFLTGSNAKVLSREIATALRGRSLSFEILPLSFSEYLAFQGIPGDLNSSGNRAKVMNALETYCYWGGFPEIVQMEDRYKTGVLQEYFNVMLYRDLVERYEIRDVSVLKYLIKRMIHSFTKEFSINKLYNDLKSRGFSIGKDSIYDWVEEIFAIYMLTSIEKYNPAIVKREMSNKKVHLYDNGIAAAVQYFSSEDRGKRLENLVFCHLRAQANEVFFLKNGWECDFVVFERNSPPVLYQVTERLDSNNIARELKGLEKGREYLGNSDCWMLAETVSKDLEIPHWCKIKEIPQWLLER